MAISTKHQLVYMLTKYLGPQQFKCLLSKMGVIRGGKNWHSWV